MVMQIAVDIAIMFKVAAELESFKYADSMPKALSGPREVLAKLNKTL